MTFDQWRKDEEGRSHHDNSLHYLTSQTQYLKLAIGEQEVGIKDVGQLPANYLMVLSLTLVHVTCLGQVADAKAQLCG